MPDQSAGRAATTTTSAEFHAWQARPPAGARGREGFQVGHYRGAMLIDDGLTVAGPLGERFVIDPFVDTPDGMTTGPVPVGCQTASWTSPLHRLGRPAREIIVSWNARTPGRSWIEVQVQALTRPAGTRHISHDIFGCAPGSDPAATSEGAAESTATRGDAGTPSTWFTMARWCERLPAQGGGIHRASFEGQADADALVDTDILRAADDRVLIGYRLRVNLMAPAGAAETPLVSLLGAVTSPSPELPDPLTAAAAAPIPSADPAASRRSIPTPASAPGPAPVPARELPVPPLSQMPHRGQYPQWGGGGASWCSPTSVAMAMAYHQVGPTPEELSWVHPQEDSLVPFSARATWDHGYRGAGNWAFSVAYPAEYGLEAFVTRLAGLAEAGAFISAGIPLVASVAFGNGELEGAGYSTMGHLLLIIGFTRRGDVIVNDPASHQIPDDNQVRVVYRRDQFEKVWMRGSGGTVYVIHPSHMPLPAGPATGI